VVLTTGDSAAIDTEFTSFYQRYMAHARRS
jgi:hypothetical protein